jgi:hypothetical protein
LSVACLALLITASFATQTSAGVLPPGVHRSVSGRLHDLGSGALSVALFGAVALSALRLRTLRTLSVALLVCAVVSDLALLAIGPEVGGLRQRALVALGCCWQAFFVRALQSRKDAASARSATDPALSMSR